MGVQIILDQDHLEENWAKPLLIRLTVTATQLHALTELYPHEEGPRADNRLAQLSTVFDSTHAEALHVGVPLDTEFQLVVAGHDYIVRLTEDGLEYRLLT